MSDGTPTFLITSIAVNFPDAPPQFAPIVATVDNHNRITRGWWAGNKQPLTDGPLVISQAGSANSLNPFISTPKGQYQIYWNNGGDGNAFYILLQSFTSPLPYPQNQRTLWKGNLTLASFQLSIDLTASDDGISLIPA